MRGPVLKVLALVLNRALSFDLCVCPPGAIAPYAEELDGRVAGILARLAVASGDAAPDVERAVRLMREP
eukprot:14429389-Alexandrium_andersonii.AAC.1